MLRCHGMKLRLMFVIDFFQPAIESGAGDVQMTGSFVHILIEPLKRGQDMGIFDVTQPIRPGVDSSGGIAQARKMTGCQWSSA